MIIFSQLANPSSVLANIKTRDLYIWFNLLYKAMSPSQVDDTTSHDMTYVPSMKK